MILIGRKTSLYCFYQCIKLSLLLTVTVIASQAWTLDAQNGIHSTGRLSRRNSVKNRTNQEQMFFASLEEDFLSNLGVTLNSLSAQHRPLLVHTSLYMQGDLLVFMRQNDENTTIPITASTYRNLKAVSHLPVTAVTLLIPDLLANNGTLTGSQLAGETKQRLIEFRETVQNASNHINDSFPLPDQASRQEKIIEAVLVFLDSVLINQSDIITMETLTYFADSLNKHLRDNSRDAVKDYLICLNGTISSLIMSENITLEEWKDLVVIDSLDPFAQSGSFLAQYYNQLLNISTGSERLILAPGSLNQQTSSNCTIPPQNPSADSLFLFSNTYLVQSVNKIFNNGSSSLHTTLSLAAAEIICSEDLLLPSCVNETVLEQGDHIVGFETRIEKSYIVLMIFFGGIAVMCGIVLSCIMYEDRLMSAERKSRDTKENFKIDGPTVFTPVSSVEESGFSGSSVVVNRRAKETSASEGGNFDNRISTCELLSSSTDA